MKIKNNIENLIISIIVAIVVMTAFNYLKFKPMEKQFKQQIETQTELIKELSKIEKYKIENSFDKVKAKKGTVAIQVTSEIIKSESDTLNSYTAVKKKKIRLFNIFKKKL